MASSTTNINTQQTQTFGFNIHVVNRKNKKFQRIELNAAGTPFSFLDFTQSKNFSLREDITKLDYNLKLLSTETNFEPEDLANFFFIQETCSVASKLIISNKNLFLDFIANLSYQEVKLASTVGVKVSSLEVTEVNDYEGTSTGLTLTNQDGTLNLELILDDEQQQVTELYFNGSASSYKDIQAVTMIESSFALAS